MEWDIALIIYEQDIIASPIYANASALALKRMNQVADQRVFSWHGWLGGLGHSTPDFGLFDAEVTDTQARIDIPLLMLYPSTYKPKWKGFKDKIKSDGTLNQWWYGVFWAQYVRIKNETN